MELHCSCSHHFANEWVSIVPSYLLNVFQFEKLCLCFVQTIPFHSIHFTNGNFLPSTHTHSSFWTQCSLICCNSFNYLLLHTYVRTCTKALTGCDRVSCANVRLFSSIWNPVGWSKENCSNYQDFIMRMCVCVIFLFYFSSIAAQEPIWYPTQIIDIKHALFFRARSLTLLSLSLSSSPNRFFFLLNGVHKWISLIQNDFSHRIYRKNVISLRQFG